MTPRRSPEGARAEGSGEPERPAGQRLTPVPDEPVRARRPAAERRPVPERRRVAIEDVSPQVEGGRFPGKAIAGDGVVVEADFVLDGHDRVGGALLYRREGDADWREIPMRHVENDRWRGRFPADELGSYQFTVRAWLDRFEAWRHRVKTKVANKQSVAEELEEGAALLDATARRASGSDRRDLRTLAGWLRAGGRRGIRTALSEDLRELMAAHPDRREAVGLDRELTVVAERARARFGAWYELFPRSTAAGPGRHGTFADVAGRLPAVAAMGFDVVYLPPIHPIGHTRRRGKNNAARSGARDVGSPWAIGDETGGHTAVHPDLGTLGDFDTLVTRAGSHGLEIALDLAFQCSPDHPWVSEHPEWFRHRSDGTIHHAENPPKKYEDIYPLDFECEDWRGLWDALLEVVAFWAEHGVRIFRVDNPHTKPFTFWEWLIREARERYPDVIFLSEAFTRNKVMYRLAKLGFSQSYTYFTWRHTKAELTEYFEELVERLAYFRPNVWPNTPDILDGFLRDGGRPAFMIRLTLAATLAASYGMYGPAFELGEAEPMAPDREEYRNSEKYQIRDWDLDRPGSLTELIARINRIRRENRALQFDHSLRFHEVDNEQLIAYSKRSDDGSNTILVVVNLDPREAQAGWVDLDLEALEIEPDAAYQVHDLVRDVRYRWQGARNYVMLDPTTFPAHVFRVQHREPSERDFEHFM